MLMMLTAIAPMMLKMMAASAYKDVVHPALKHAYLGRQQFLILEGSGPTGNLSKKGVAAKADCRTRVSTIPKRSPDLNVLDFTMWS